MFDHYQVLERSGFWTGLTIWKAFCMACEWFKQNVGQFAKIECWMVPNHCLSPEHSKWLRILKVLRSPLYFETVLSIVTDNGCTMSFFLLCHLPFSCRYPRLFDSSFGSYLDESDYLLLVWGACSRGCLNLMLRTGTGVSAIGCESKFGWVGFLS